MIRDRYEAAWMFLPKRVWHRFREPDGFFVRQCVTGSGLRIARVRRPSRSMPRCISSTSPRPSNQASNCRTSYVLPRP